MKRKLIFIRVIFFIVCFSLIFPVYSKLTSFTKKRREFVSLRKQVAYHVSAQNAEVSFLIRDLTFPNLCITRKENERFPAASLIKLPILAVVFYAVGDSELSLEQEINIYKKDIVGGSGVIKSKQMPFKTTLGELLQYMISQSDNTATNKIIDILGVDYTNRIFKKLNLKHSRLNRKMMDFSGRKRGVENYISARDIGIILEKIYNGKLINREFSQYALTFLKNQKIKDRIPRYLPTNILVAHKTGLERSIIHDAGIVFTPEGDYIICVLIKKAKDYKQAKNFIAKLSSLTYNFYK